MRPVGQPAGGLFDASAQTSRHTFREATAWNHAVCAFFFFSKSSGFRVGSVSIWALRLAERRRLSTHFAHVPRAAMPSGSC
jgi:hypothetical protein